MASTPEVDAAAAAPQSDPFGAFEAPKPKPAAAPKATETITKVAGSPEVIACLSSAITS